MSGFVELGVIVARSPSLRDRCHCLAGAAHLRADRRHGVSVGHHPARIRRGLGRIILAGCRGAVVIGRDDDLVTVDAAFRVDVVERHHSPVFDPLGGFRIGAGQRQIQPDRHRFVGGQPGPGSEGGCHGKAGSGANDAPPGERALHHDGLLFCMAPMQVENTEQGASGRPYRDRPASTHLDGAGPEIVTANAWCRGATSGIDWLQKKQLPPIAAHLTRAMWVLQAARG